MNLMRKRTRSELPVSTSNTDAPVAVTESYTNGGALASTAMAWVLRIMLIVCFLGVLLFITMMFKPKASTGESAPTVISAEQPALTQSAGSYALGYVGTWLSATREDSVALQGYVSTAPASLGTEPTQYRNLAVASISQLEDESRLLVTVSGEVLERATPDAEPTWTLRYYSVTVSTENNTLSTAGYPALIAGPARSTSEPPTAFTVTVNTSSPASQTVELFLTAYLTGQGSISPYLSPGVSISPITPVPYKTLSVTAVKASTAPASDPAEGATTLLETIVTAQADIDQSVTSTYRFLLTARAGRWEVTALNTAAPQVSETPAPNPTTTTAPSPSDG